MHIEDVHNCIASYLWDLHCLLWMVTKLWQPQSWDTRRAGTRLRRSACVRLSRIPKQNLRSQMMLLLPQVEPEFLSVYFVGLEDLLQWNGAQRWAQISFARRGRGFVFYFRDMGEGDCVLSLTLSRFSDGDLCLQGSMTIHRMPEQQVSAIHNCIASCL